MEKRINVIDIETFGNEPIPYCCSIIYMSRTVTAYGLTCINSILKWIFTFCPNKTIFFAHNLTFDGSILLSNLPNDVKIGKKFNCFRGGNIYSLCLEKNDILIIFRCSFRMLPLELSEISKKLKLPLKLEIDHSIINNDNFNKNEIRNEIKKYCERDVLIVHRFMVKLGLSVIDFTANWWFLTYSVSGLSLIIFNFFNKEHNINLILDFDKDEQLRPSYYGGRCEVFGNPLENEKIFHFDFSGMYSNRLKEEYPIDAGKLNKNPKKIEKPGFYSVTVESHLELPILPFRDVHTGKLIFPNGIFSGLYWYEELQLFEENGGIILKYHWSVEFDKMGKPFKDFAEKCIELRKETLLNNILWKLIPNSFIGRLGLKPDYEKTLIINREEYDPFKYNIICDRFIGTQVLIRIKTCSEDINMKGNVIYPSIVTSKARIIWWKSAKSVIENNGRLLYCDTDSIFAAYMEDVSGKTHGDIFWDSKKNDCIIKKACFATSKVYSIILENQNITKIKGIPKKKSQINFEEFEELFYNSKKKNINFDFFDKTCFKIKISEIIKEIDFSNYDKRTFDKTKKFTTALEINEK